MFGLVKEKRLKLIFMLDIADQLKMRFQDLCILELRKLCWKYQCTCSEKVTGRMK